MRRRLLLASVFVASMSSPVIAAAAEEAVPGIEITVEFSASEVARESVVIRVPAGQTATIAVRLWDPADPTTSAQATDVSALLEIRETSGAAAGPPVRLAAMEEIAPGEYRADYTFSIPGTWTVVALPDVVDRASLPEGSTGQLTFVVFGGEEGSSVVERSSYIAAAALVVLIVVVVLLLARRRRRHDLPPPKPAQHDTWWSTP